MKGIMESLLRAGADCEFYSGSVSFQCPLLEKLLSLNVAVKI